MPGCTMSLLLQALISLLCAGCAAGRHVVAPHRDTSCLVPSSPENDPRTFIQPPHHPDFLTVIGTDGSYTICIQQTAWVHNASAFFIMGGHKYSTADGSLKLLKYRIAYGQDKLGHFSSTTFWYAPMTNALDQKAVLRASIRGYGSPPALIFTQEFLEEVQGSSSKDRDSVVTSFPSFTTNVDEGTLGLLSLGGSMTGNNGKRMGLFSNETANINVGITGGPLVLFDKAGHVLIQSPYSSFMASSLGHEDGDASWHWGVMGLVDNIPKGYSSSFVLFYGDKGINKAVRDWGRLLRKTYDKTTTYMESDLTNNYLGYWTDNGAFYYYHTEDGKNYQDTLLDVNKYASQKNIPYRYVQYDSWFYPKGHGGGVKTWTSMDAIFPDGLQYVYNKTGWPVNAHNRWWSIDTSYATQNGGKFNFIIEDKKAIPQDMRFWDWLMRESKKWGLVTYEQDWLDVEFGGMNATQSDVHVADNWLHQMGKAARENGITIQYCMSNPRHILKSVQIPAVTQARASDDYHPGNSQWKIGVSSMWAYGLGYAPFKDNFWTMTTQTGTSYDHGKATEPNVYLQTVVATLSTGPVGPSDAINFTNTDLLMTCCANDGLILKPSKPATAIDDQIIMVAYGSPIGELWTTYSEVGGWLFGIILAAEMQQDYAIGPMAAGFGNVTEFPKSKIFGKTKTMDFSETNTLTIKASECTTKSPCLYWTTPVMNLNGDEILIIGETAKTVRISPQRVNNIDITLDAISLDIRGSYQESVKFVYTRNGSSYSVTCVLPMTGRARIVIAAEGTDQCITV